jgi:putative transposase
VKYACIASHQREHPVRLMCRVLEVARSGFYAWRRRGASAHARRDAQVLGAVRVAYAASAGTYGAPRVHQELRAGGHRVGKKRVARLMRHAGLRGRAPQRRGVRTTDARHGEPLAPNLVARHFAVADATGPRAVNRVWVSDITYVPTGAGWLYLATVLDLASRRVIGWAMRDTLEAELALSALRMALHARHPAPGLIHHSDRGVHYACADYRAELARHGAIASMSRTGDCWDNAVAESFFATLEHELIMRRQWRTRDEARQAIFHYIETWYNPRRRHSSLGYRSPAHYEEELTTKA